MKFEEAKTYRWFYTSSDKLVVGGKSASQNDELLKNLNKEYWIMHTSAPGSPFCVIISPISKVTKKDLEECAIFCGCFSRAWKEGKKKTTIHLFKNSQVSKKKGMKSGTWGVVGKVKEIKVELELVLTKQKKILRAVPEKSVMKKNTFLKVCPGKIDKKNMVNKILKEIGKDFDKNDILSALPPGGVRICGRKNGR